MQWTKMTRHQQGTARKLVEKLWAAGVTGPTTSQVARHFDEAVSWQDGTMTLEVLCAVTGWTAPAPAAAAPDAQATEPESVPAPAPVSAETEPTVSAPVGLAAAAAAVNAAVEQLHAFMRAAQVAGVSANKIAEQVAGIQVLGYSRPNVFKLLGATGLRERAEQILLDGGWKLGSFGDARLYLGPTREVRITLHDADNSVRALNDASALCNALRDGGLGTWADGNPDTYQVLARGESIEITGT